MSEIMYKKGSRRKKNLTKSKNTPREQLTSHDVEKRIDERITWCKETYGEDKMNKLIDMSVSKVREKALHRLMSQNNVLRSYIKLLCNDHVYVFGNTNCTQTVWDSDVIQIASTSSENPNTSKTVYCTIHIAHDRFSVSSSILALTTENIRYIKRLVYLSALGQIS